MNDILNNHYLKLIMPFIMLFDIFKMLLFEIYIISRLNVIFIKMILLHLFKMGQIFYIT